jgi:hypothetical protein
MSLVLKSCCRGRNDKFEQQFAPICGSGLCNSSAFSFITEADIAFGKILACYKKAVKIHLFNKPNILK